MQLLLQWLLGRLPRLLGLPWLLRLLLQWLLLQRLLLQRLLLQRLLLQRLLRLLGLQLLQLVLLLVLGLLLLVLLLGLLQRWCGSGSARVLHLWLRRLRRARTDRS
jgi:hypothetical protein